MKKIQSNIYLVSASGLMLRWKMAAWNDERLKADKEWLNLLFKFYDLGIARGIIKHFMLPIMQRIEIAECKETIFYQKMLMEMDRDILVSFSQNQKKLIATKNAVKKMVLRQYYRAKEAELQKEKLYRFIYKYSDCEKCNLLYVFGERCQGNFEDCKNRIGYAARRETGQ